MPEFIMDTRGTVGTGLGHGGSLTWQDISEFNRGYIEALFFCESSPCYNKSDWLSAETQAAITQGQSDGNIPGDSCFGDIESRSLARVWKLCHDFKNEAAAQISAAQDLEPGSVEFRYGRDYLDARRLGQLFYYASNGHGVGFTDDGSAACLSELQDMAHRSRELYVSYNGEFVFFE